MPDIEVSKIVNAPADRVWAILTDLEGSEFIVSGIESVEVLSGDDMFGVGTRWRETRKMMGREATEEMEVTAIDPGRSYTVEADNHGAHYTSGMAVTDIGDGKSRLTMTFEAEANTTGGKLMVGAAKLFKGATRKAIQQDLEDIAAAAEQLS
ncbi:MAG TPA: SRPBCC family protein [Acidimicrobiia bacterium]|jgi:uncharacterized membrane protein|nr:SRPBCC family protein [Acidimicrobiia bacterium]